VPHNHGIWPALFAGQELRKTQKRQLAASREAPRRNIMLGKRNHAIALLVLLFALQPLVFATGSVTLSFTSLPSTQGWTYFSDGASETSIFSLNDGVLVMNTLAGPWTAERYKLAAVDPTLPFTITIRARILQDSGSWLCNTPNPVNGLKPNPYGFGFGATVEEEWYLIGLSTNLVAGNMDIFLNNADNTAFHDYRLEVIPGVGYVLYRDGTLLGSGPPFIIPQPDPDGFLPNNLAFGDSTRGCGALAEVASYRFTQVKEVRIDIKPGSEPNSINVAAAGVIPVAILSAADFDATTVDPETVSLAGASVKMVGKSGKYLCSQQDVNDDGLVDLVCQVYTAQFMVEEGSSIAVLEAKTYGGQPVRGEDNVQIVP
jgi:hypothetical protein